ncbi:MAG: FtsX-like permease family protein [Bdellovibrionales bacterium]|nr:FtsX-like permease family protein [Bdellovibrionales bacterium]
MKIKVALRNLLRHKLRTFLSLLMIVGSVSSIIIFRGFSEYILWAIHLISADSQYGHIQVATHLYWEAKGESRKKILLSRDEKLNQILREFPEVKSISGRLSGYGLLSNGNYSISVKAVGFDPQGESKMTKYMKFPQGEVFKTPTETSIIIGSGLQKKLSVQPGQDVTLVVSTMDGGVNAFDLNVVGIFSLGLDEIDQQLVFLPLQIAQKLFDTEKVDQLILTTNDFNFADKLASTINYKLDSNNMGLRAKGWWTLADNARKIENFYRSQNIMIESILITLMFLGIMNTVGMSVFERTGEIGTLRALGVTQFQIVKLFLFEGFCLALLGIIVGFGVGSLGAYLINQAKIVIEMPGASTPLSIQIHYVWSSYIIAGVICMITTLAASVVPSFRAAKLSIVEALRANV